MSIVDFETTKGNGGFKKRMDEKSFAVSIKLSQVSMYKYEVKSAVRETVSNAMDSMKEKFLALDILSGKKKVEDHYIDDDSDIKHASKFNPEYYNPKFLSDKKRIELHYYEGDPTGRDLFCVRDYGVGLGGSRLEGFFELNYSTKRNSMDFLGSWGLGSKSPLATKVPSYRVITVYNGQKSAFDVYLDKIEPVTPKFGEKGLNKLNKFERVDCEYYTESVNEPNSVEIQTEVKKYRKTEYFNAVESQLMYFDNTDFFFHSYDGVSKEINFKADVIYEDEDILISNNSEYNVPHIILGTKDTKVVYGVIDFQELELNSRKGSVGLKIDVSEVSITPSRESVIWDEKTKKTVLEKFNKVQNTAERVISDSIKDEKNFVKWVNKVSKLLSTSATFYDSSVGRVVIDKEVGVIGILGEIIDKENIEVSFASNPKIKFIKDVNKFFKHTIELSIVTYSRYANKISKTVPSRWSCFDLPVYVIDGRASRKKDAYLTFLHPSGFLLVKDTSVELFKKLNDPSIILSKELEKLKDDPTRIHSAIEAYKELLKSSNVKNYDDLEVPDSFSYSDSDDDENSKLPALSKAERRELRGEIVYYSMEVDIYNKKTTTKKIENTVDHLKSLNCTIVYGNKEDLEYLKTIGTIMEVSYRNTVLVDRLSEGSSYIYAIKVARTLNKTMKTIENAVHVKDFLYNNVNKGVLTIDRGLSKYLTARYLYNFVYQEGNRFAMYNGFELIDKECFEKHDKLIKFIRTNYTGEIFAPYDRYTKFFTLLCKYQVEGGELTQEQKLSLKRIAPEFNADQEITGVRVFDSNDGYNSAMYLKTYKTNLKLLEYIDNLENNLVSSDLVEMVKDYISDKQ